MTMQSKNWDIRFEKTAGTNKSEVKITGMVTVPTASHEPVLVQAADRSTTHLQLDLQVTGEPRFGDATLVDKPVSFSKFDLITYENVTIYQKGEVILSISGIRPAV